MAEEEIDESSEDVEEETSPEEESTSSKLASTLASQLFESDEVEPEEELPPVPRVKVGDSVYDYDFVESAVAEAEKLAGLSEEMEAELAEIRQTRQNLQELEYIVKAISQKISDPGFYQGLTALLEGRTPQSYAPDGKTLQSYTPEEEPEDKRVEEDLYAQFDQRLTQALSPIYALQAKQAAEGYLTELETQYTIKLSPEQRSAITNRAIDRGDFRSEHLFGQARENPLQGAFFETLGPELLQRVREQPKEQPKTGLPEKSRHVGRSSQQTRTSALAQELLSALRQGS